MAKKKKTTEEQITERVLVKSVSIPQIKQVETTICIIGDRPLLVNNKCSVAATIASQYDGGLAGTVKPDKLTPDEQYINAFYTMPDSEHEPPSPKGSYGVPASGIKKCVCSAIRTTGITDNTTIGLISKSFWIMEDAGGLCRLQFGELERDVRPVNIGSGQKTVPSMRHRPMFHDWRIELNVKFNARILTIDMLLNLFMHAGQYIGLCELRSEKKQGQCGGFLPGDSGNGKPKR